MKRIHTILLFFIMFASCCSAGDVYEDVEKFVLGLNYSDEEGISIIDDYEMRKQLEKDTRSWLQSLSKIVRLNTYSNTTRISAYHVAKLRGYGRELELVDAGIDFFIELREQSDANEVATIQQTPETPNILNALSIDLIKSGNEMAISEVLDYSLKNLSKEKMNRIDLENVLREVGDVGSEAHLSVLQKMIDLLADPSKQSIADKRDAATKELKRIERILTEEHIGNEEREELLLKRRILRSQAPEVNKLKEIAKESYQRIESRKLLEAKRITKDDKLENAAKREFDLEVIDITEFKKSIKSWGIFIVLFLLLVCIALVTLKRGNFIK